MDVPLYIPSLEESNVEDGGVVVNKLEQEHLEGEAILIVWVCTWTLQVGQPLRYFLVHLENNITFLMTIH